MTLVSTVFTAELARRYVCALGPSKVTELLLEKLEHEDWDGFISVRVDPRSYSDALSYFRDAAATSLLRKNRSVPLNVDRRQNAINRWRDGEAECRKTNLRLDPFLDESAQVPYLNSDQEGRVRAVIRRARKEIVRIIGRKPPESVLANARFGPGSTFQVKSRAATVPDKISSVASHTERLPWEAVLDWITTAWGTIACRSDKVTTVRGNRFTTAPKDALTDRSIGVEPDINIFYQLAVGTHFKECFKRAGWDLTRAPAVHQRLAREASISLSRCTLDLKNASDTLARALVKLLLPPAWHRLLDRLRSPMTKLGGRWHLLEKFSSMGNGYTFELESLIFAALCTAVTDGTLGTNIFVFGDDIIVDDDKAADVMACLKFFGFSVNEEKSFFGAVPFRESCGGDYYRGCDVRPHYLKENPDGPRSFVTLTNGLVRVREKLALLGLALPHHPESFVLSHLPEKVRHLRGPRELGDLVIWDDDPQTWTIRVRNCIRQIRVIKPGTTKRVSWAHFTDDVVAACAAYGLKSAHPRGWTWTREGGVTPRDAVSGWKLGWACFS